MNIGKLPECEADFAELARLNLAPFLCCVLCYKPFSSENTHTLVGWQETQISGFCEDCFDQAFEDAEEEQDVQK